MSKFILRRFIFSIPVLFGILVVTFVMLRSIPGDPCRAIVGEKATDETCDAFIARYGLDAPLPEQFRIYLTDALPPCATGSIGTWSRTISLAWM